MDDGLAKLAVRDHKRSRGTNASMAGESLESDGVKKYLIERVGARECSSAAFRKVGWKARR
jgi:hypothetical protein